MKKTKIIFSSLVIFLFSSVNSFAVDMPDLGMPSGLSIGASASAGAVRANGEENEGTTETHRQEAVMAIGYGSIFIDYAIAPALGLRIGVDYVLDTIETDEVGRTDALAPGNAGTGDTGTSTVKAKFSELTTVYLEMPVLDTGFYLKAGMKSVDVTTKENLHTGSTYGNTSLDGTMFGFGSKIETDLGAFVKFEAQYTDFDDLNLTSQTNSANNVKGELEGVTASISIGKTF